jgi:UDP-N-acetylglucosamine diphosphorylase/glucosamine-1-phosphate N-acetyltransferase
MKIFLDDSKCLDQLLPFTHTRHVADIRIGILTIREKWEKITGYTVYTSIEDKEGSDLVINANFIPTPVNFKAILEQKEQPGRSESDDIRRLIYPWHIFQYNDWAIRHDFELLTRDKLSMPISQTNKCLNEANIFIEEDAVLEHCIINATNGPVYIGKQTTIMEGNMIRGPFAICQGAVLKMGSKVYGATTIGPFCIAGGEIKNSVMFGYSNKAHDGYLGDSVIGEWCNLGAGTSNSNIKNTAGEVKYNTGDKTAAIAAGNKGGLLMGDYSRAAINTSFNTGTVVGVCCNIFDRHFPGKYIANFSWGSDRYDLNKAIIDTDNWKKLKGMRITEKEKKLLSQLYHSNL